MQSAHSSTRSITVVSDALSRRQTHSASGLTADHSWQCSIHPDHSKQDEFQKWKLRNHCSICSCMHATHILARTTQSRMRMCTCPFARASLTIYRPDRPPALPSTCLSTLRGFAERQNRAACSQRYTHTSRVCAFNSGSKIVMASG